MKKTLTTLAIAGSLTFFGASAAQATYIDDEIIPGEETNVSIGDNDGVVNVGDTFIFSGANFAPFETVNITIVLLNEPTAAGTAGSAGIGGGFGAGVTGLIVPTTVIDTPSTEADADGNWSIAITLDTPGEYELTAVGEESGEEQSARVTVTEPTTVGAGGTGTLPDGSGTGSAADDDTNQEAVANGDRLADTGLESGAILWGAAGVLALGAGATAVIVSRRKNA